MSIWKECSSTSGCTVGLRGSQKQQSRPGELVDDRLLAANRGELILNISSSAFIIMKIVTWTKFFFCPQRQSAYFTSSFPDLKQNIHNIWTWTVPFNWIFLILFSYFPLPADPLALCQTDKQPQNDKLHQNYFGEINAVLWSLTTEPSLRCCSRFTRLGPVVRW